MSAHAVPRPSPLLALNDPGKVTLDRSIPRLPSPLPYSQTLCSAASRYRPSTSTDVQPPGRMIAEVSWPLRRRSCLAPTRGDGHCHCGPVRDEADRRVMELQRTTRDILDQLGRPRRGPPPRCCPGSPLARRPERAARWRLRPPPNASRSSSIPVGTSPGGPRDRGIPRFAPAQLIRSRGKAGGERAVPAGRATRASRRRDALRRRAERRRGSAHAKTRYRCLAETHTA